MIEEIIIIICLTIIVICSIIEHYFNREKRKICKEIDKRIQERREWSSNEIGKSIREYDLAHGEKDDSNPNDL